MERRKSLERRVCFLAAVSSYFWALQRSLGPGSARPQGRQCSTQQQQSDRYVDKYVLCGDICIGFPIEQDFEFQNITITDANSGADVTTAAVDITIRPIFVRFIPFRSTIP
uniref:hypothetical protein n=1 Tax=Rhizobium rhizogenes TaxID=359 RepID=UPI00190FF120|nr:hypothetical protein [Rhizobium rhizogenes]